MHLFKSKEQNLVHYVTGITFRRVPVFRDSAMSSLFIEALSETRIKDPFKLIGYVVMPDHFHLLINPIDLNITEVVGKLKGRSAAKILNKFIRQKLNYIHLNPVRAGLCDHPAKWRWSSYHAYVPHEPETVPIEIDWRWLWTADEFAKTADKSAV